jgi:hypothetical protein
MWQCKKGRKENQMLESDNSGRAGQESLKGWQACCSPTSGGEDFNENHVGF